MKRAILLPQTYGVTKRSRTRGQYRPPQDVMMKPYYPRRRKRRRQLDTELKFTDQTIDQTTVPTTGTIVNSGSILTIAEGNTSSTRDGRRITIKKVQYRLDLKWTGATVGDSEEIVRIIVYQDKQTNGATATAALLLQAVDFNSFRNIDNAARFRFLSDKTYMVGDDSAIPLTLHCEEYIDCNIPVNYSSTTGAITEMTSNNIGILYISKHGDVDVEDSRLRVRFVDR